MEGLFGRDMYSPMESDRVMKHILILTLALSLAPGGSLSQLNSPVTNMNGRNSVIIY